MSNLNTRETSNRGRFGAGNRNGKKYDYWSNKTRQVYRKGAIESLPVLGIHSRAQYLSPEVLYTTWAEALEVYIRREYGEIADIFTLGDYPEFEEVQYDEDLLSNGDPFGLERKKIEARIQLYEKTLYNLEKNKAKVYSVIYGQLSQETINRVKMTGEWPRIERTKDPLALIERVKICHYTSGIGDSNENKYEVRERLRKCQQGAFESIVEFKKRFDACLEACTSVGQEIYEDEDLGREFLGRLDMHRYANMMAGYRNGIYPRVSSLNEAYEFAANFVEPTKTNHGHKVIFTTVGHKTGKRNKADQHKKSESENSNARKSEVSEFQNSGESDNRKQGGSGSQKKKQHSRPGPDYPCKGCGATDHWIKDCPNTIKKDVSELKSASINMCCKAVGSVMTCDTFEKDDMKLYAEFDQEIIPHNHNAIYHELADVGLIAAQAWDPFQVILDSGANASVFKNRQMIWNCRAAEAPLILNGVQEGSRPIISNIVAETIFGSVHVSDHAIANILALSDMRDRAEILIFNMEEDRFELQMRLNGEIYYFNRKNGLYVYELNPTNTILMTTVEENKRKYKKREVRDAEKARDLLRKMGLPSVASLIKLINNGSILNCPVTAHDVLRAQDIWGPEAASLKGKTTTHRGSVVKIEPTKQLFQTEQSMHTDLMFIEGHKPYLVSVIVPLDYLFIDKLSSKQCDAVGKVLMKQISVMKSRGIRITHLMTDPEGGIIALTAALNEKGIIVNPTGSKEAVPVIERTIRIIKERFRSIIYLLPFTLGIIFTPYLLKYIEGRLNMMPKRTAESFVSPRESLFGRKIDFRKDLALSFGDYVQAHRNDPSTLNNARIPRTDGAIALYPTGNLEGSWYFFNLNTNAIIKRDRWTKLPMPDMVITHLNNISEREERPHQREPLFAYGNETNLIIEEYTEEEWLEEEYIEEIVAPTWSEAQSVPEISEIIVDENEDVHETETLDEQNERNNEEKDDNQSEVITPPTVEDNFHPQNNSSSTTYETFEEEQPVESNRIHSYNLRNRKPEHGRWAAGRSRRDVNHDNRFGLHLTVNQALRKLGKAAMKSIVAEMIQMHQKNVFEGIYENDLGLKKKQIISSSMFLKEKYYADGQFEKIKARLVAGGHQQDQEIFRGISSSPTVSTSSVFIISAIAAKERRQVVTIDFPGAYLNADMPEGQDEVFIRLDKFLTKVIVEVDPEFKKFVNNDGTLVVKLKKALYGCVQSSRLWYERLRDDLLKIGFQINPHDACVFNRVSKTGNQITACIHVDDMMLTAKESQDIDDAIGELHQFYPSLSIKKDNKVNYLGMVFDFNKTGKVKITMNKYVEDFLEECHDIEGIAVTPAHDGLFKVNTMSKLLTLENKQKFHTRVAKLLYLGKRTRPDILIATVFLTTRVLKPTEEDELKLERLIRYIRNTKHLGIELEPGDSVNVVAYIDAAYGVHVDYRSHTGVVISIGLGPVYASSARQKINTKSSTEAELVGLSDKSSQVIWTINFLEAQGFDVKPAKIYQDNQSTLALIKSGKSNSERTRHIAIRFFFVADRVACNEIKLEYMPTEHMLADILTKPLQGSKFLRARKLLLNWNE